MVLENKQVFITGGSGEIGRSLAHSLAKAGADITLTYFSNHDGAEATAQLVRAAGRNCTILRAHLGKDKSVEALLEIIRTIGPFDIFIHNAASGVLKPMSDLTTKHWDWTHQVNVRSFFALTQTLFSDGIIRDRGRILALSSLGALRAIPQYAVVGSSKAALESLIRHVAAEVGVRQITANVLSPGVIDTWSLKQFPNREELLGLAQMRTPIGRLTTPEDVAKTALFLCSDEASMITGQTITVDGGYSILA
ncbi:MAG: SDR family oxidoreductase [Bradymonadia bacterium]